ncbi:hypothetical protein TcWFU_004334 [Taenia crassiceps]|uniref:Uncharacterized protein n=1 Tax=Taenia crassiceps TaxID=6207 RepID=A0ABR4Q828_9CEST
MLGGNAHLCVSLLDWEGVSRPGECCASSASPFPRLRTSAPLHLCTGLWAQLVDVPDCRDKQFVCTAGHAKQATSTDSAASLFLPGRCHGAADYRHLRVSVCMRQTNEPTVGRSGVNTCTQPQPCIVLSSNHSTLTGLLVAFDDFRGDAVKETVWHTITRYAEALKAVGVSSGNVRTQRSAHIPALFSQADLHDGSVRGSAALECWENVLVAKVHAQQVAKEKLKSWRLKGSDDRSDSHLRWQATTPPLSILT